MAESDSGWYLKAFSNLYPILYPHRNDEQAEREIAGLEEMLRLAGNERILDCCCGTGRHLKALLARGYDAWGVDLSEALLKRAAAVPALTGRVVRADVVNLPFKSEFDLELCLFTSFGYFTQDEDNLAALEEMVSVLRTGGTLVIDHINRGLLEQRLVPESRERRRGKDIIQSRRIRGNRVLKNITVKSNGKTEVRLTEDVRLFSPEELMGWLDRAGLAQTRFVGSFAGEEFSSKSERMIAIAVKE